MSEFFLSIWQYADSKGGLVTALFAVILVIIFREILRMGSGIVKAGISMKRDRLLETLPSLFGYINLRNEPIFKTLKRHLDQEIPHLNIKCVLRKKIFSKLMTYKAVASWNALSTLIDKNLDAMSNEQFKSELLDEFAIADADRLQRGAQEGIPKIAVDKFEETVMKDRTFLRHASVETCFLDSLYSNNKKKMRAILALLNSEEILTYNAIDKTLYELNGEISALIFEGVTCSGCDTHCPNNIVLHPHK